MEKPLAPGGEGDGEGEGEGEGEVEVEVESVCISTSDSSEQGREQEEDEQQEGTSTRSDCESEQRVSHKPPTSGSVTVSVGSSSSGSGGGKSSNSNRNSTGSEPEISGGSDDEDGGGGASEADADADADADTDTDAGADADADADADPNADPNADPTARDGPDTSTAEEDKAPRFHPRVVLTIWLFFLLSVVWAFLDKAAFPIMMVLSYWDLIVTWWSGGLLPVILYLIYVVVVSGGCRCVKSGVFTWKAFKDSPLAITVQSISLLLHLFARDSFAASASMLTDTFSESLDGAFWKQLFMLAFFMVLVRPVHRPGIRWLARRLMRMWLVGRLLQLNLIILSPILFLIKNEYAMPMSLICLPLILLVGSVLRARLVIFVLEHVARVLRVVLWDTVAVVSGYLSSSARGMEWLLTPLHRTIPLWNVLVAIWISFALLLACVVLRSQDAEWSRSRGGWPAAAAVLLMLGVTGSALIQMLDVALWGGLIGFLYTCSGFFCACLSAILVLPHSKACDHASVTVPSSSSSSATNLDAFQKRVVHVLQKRQRVALVAFWGVGVAVSIVIWIDRWLWSRSIMPRGLVQRRIRMRATVGNGVMLLRDAADTACRLYTV